MNIYWDIDESLISSSTLKDRDDCLTVVLDTEVYFTTVRRGAHKVIDFSRSLVGPDHVYILTAATYDYAAEINHLANFGFAANQILCRRKVKKEIKRIKYKKGYISPYSSKKNVILDNMTPKYNVDKLMFAGIQDVWTSRYFQVEEFWGAHKTEDFVEKCLDFLVSRYYNIPIEDAWDLHKTKQNASE